MMSSTWTRCSCKDFVSCCLVNGKGLVEVISGGRVMLFPKARMIVSLCLFLGWIGFLFYLVLESPQTIVPWRRFETAHFYVVADIRENQGKLDPQVTIEEILWPPPPA